MVEEGDWVLIFHSIHRVMKAEMLLKERAVPMLLIPVPRDLASDCGLALRIKPEALATTLQELETEGLTPSELHQMTAGGFVQNEEG